MSFAIHLFQNLAKLITALYIHIFKLKSVAAAFACYFIAAS